MESSPDLTRTLLAAEGYLELAMPHDALGELEQIPETNQEELRVVLLRMMVLQTLKRWSDMYGIGTSALRSHPEAGDLYLLTAYAARRAHNLNEAYSILSSGESVLESEGAFHFNMACYECQMGNLAAAHTRLSRACAIDKQWKLAALKDSDLEPIWQSI